MIPIDMLLQFGGIVADHSQHCALLLNLLAGPHSQASNQRQGRTPSLYGMLSEKPGYSNCEKKHLLSTNLPSSAALRASIEAFSSSVRSVSHSLSNSLSRESILSGSAIERAILSTMACRILSCVCRSVCAGTRSADDGIIRETFFFISVEPDFPGVILSVNDMS